VSAISTIQGGVRQAVVRYAAFLEAPRVRVARALGRFLLWPVSLVSGSVTLVALSKTVLTLAGVEGMFGWPETWALFSSSRESFLRWLLSGSASGAVDPTAFYFLVSISLAAVLSFGILLRLYFFEARAAVRGRAGGPVAPLVVAPLRDGALTLQFVEFFLGLNGSLPRRLLGPFLTGYLFSLAAGLWPLLVLALASWFVRGVLGVLLRGAWFLGGWFADRAEARAWAREQARSEARARRTEAEIPGWILRRVERRRAEESRGRRR
jgi:hypothetical protein